jgi:CO/xanthine dehydrogenase FAD-binding subunit
MAAIERYLAPKALAEAAEALATDQAAALAGGTDLWPRWSRDQVRRPGIIVDLKKIEELRELARVGGEVHVGACLCMDEIASSPLIRESAPILAEAAGRIACPQVRNRATVGGNLCNASPAADLAVPLIVLDAVLDLAAHGPKGLRVRQVPITDFFLGPGRTRLAHGEVLVRIRFRLLPGGAFWAWDKFGTRPSMEIAVASVGLVLGRRAEVVTRARVGYGSVAPVPLRGRKAEAELEGRPLSDETIGRCVAAAGEEISPISDVRAGRGYRREMVRVMLGRMLERARRC